MAMVQAGMGLTCVVILIGVGIAGSGRPLRLGAAAQRLDLVADRLPPSGAEGSVPPPSPAPGTDLVRPLSLHRLSVSCALRLILSTWWIGDNWSSLMQSVGASEKAAGYRSWKAGFSMPMYHFHVHQDLRYQFWVD